MPPASLAFGPFLSLPYLELSKIKRPNEIDIGWVWSELLLPTLRLAGARSWSEDGWLLGPSWGQQDPDLLGQRLGCFYDRAVAKKDSSL